MGRPRKPTALKVVQGNAGKRPLNYSEPQPKKERPRCPSHLTPKAKTAFKNVCDLLEEMGILTIADGLSLELMCSAYAEWRDLRKVIERDGATYETESVAGGLTVKARPEVAMASDAWKRVKSMMAEYGLTAAARSKVDAKEPEKLDPLAEYMNRRNKR